MPPSWLRGASRYLINHSYKPQFYFLHLRTTFPSRKGRNSLSCTWRNASSLSSSTAINASKTIPTRYKELHDDLQAVKKNAAAFVDLSRLELALQGLETENFTTRIAGTSNSLIRFLDRILIFLSAWNQRHQYSETSCQTSLGGSPGETGSLGSSIGWPRYSTWDPTEVGLQSC